jgi:plastocyanin
MHNAAARRLRVPATGRVASETLFCKTNLPKRTFAILRNAWKPVLAAGAFCALACGVPLWAASQANSYLVRQKGQMFNPGVLSIREGETVAILNDDGELIHHAYVDSKSFSFDSGDQEPGSKTDIVFSVPGDFVVLCGIHPKMRLYVSVK